MLGTLGGRNKSGHGVSGYVERTTKTNFAQPDSHKAGRDEIGGAMPFAGRAPRAPFLRGSICVLTGPLEVKSGSGRCSV
jgi:hypothetical protein